MIRHIVLWKLKESAEGADKSENIRRMKEMLESLTGKVPGIRSLEVGVNFNPSDAGWDVALFSGFATQEDLDAYQKHPEHLKAGEFIGKVRENRAVVDYEI